MTASSPAPPAQTPLQLSSDSEHEFKKLDQLEIAGSATPSAATQTAQSIAARYEVPRTVANILETGWRRIALQFPDELLRDAPIVFEALRDGLRERRRKRQEERASGEGAERGRASGKNQSESTPGDRPRADLESFTGGKTQKDGSEVYLEDEKEKLFILADTSYGSCCVDEIAAEHGDADVVVHYGRSCMSAPRSLPVVYVYPALPLDLDPLVALAEKEIPLGVLLVLMCDPAYLCYLPEIRLRLQKAGYQAVFLTEPIIANTSPIPNRRIFDPDSISPVSLSLECLQSSTVMHIGDPPAALLLNLQSKVTALHIYTPSTAITPPSLSLSTATPALRRRYALLSRIPSLGTLGILIASPTLDTCLSTLAHCQRLIRDAGKKAYVFVVGKVNPAKLANFAEIDIWVVIGCWETSLVEGEGFYRGMITVWELELGLRGDRREWAGEWGVHATADTITDEPDPTRTDGVAESEAGSDPESAPPDFDLQTGRLVSTAISRPVAATTRISGMRGLQGSEKPHLSRELVTTRSDSQIGKHEPGEISSIRGVFSPGAAALKARAWRGLGTEWLEVGYEGEDGPGPAQLEEGRKGLARGYVVGDEPQEVRR